MREEFRKQSQTSYVLSFQRITTEEVPFFQKNECLRSMIQGNEEKEAKTKPSKVDESNSNLSILAGRDGGFTFDF